MHILFRNTSNEIPSPLSPEEVTIYHPDEVVSQHEEDIQNEERTEKSDGVHSTFGGDFLFDSILQTRDFSQN